MKNINTSSRMSDTAIICCVVNVALTAYILFFLSPIDNRRVPLPRVPGYNANTDALLDATRLALCAYTLFAGWIGCILLAETRRTNPRGYWLVTITFVVAAASAVGVVSWWLVVAFV